MRLLRVVDFFSEALTPTAFVILLYSFVVAIFCLITMSARSRCNSNLCLSFDGTEIESLNHTDFDNSSCERVVAKPTGEGLSNCDLGEACASITTPIVGRTPDNVGRKTMSSASDPRGDSLRKIKTQHRELVLDINRYAAALLA